MGNVYVGRRSVLINERSCSYTFAGKKHKIETDKPNFSRLADRPGTFKITSVSHRKAAHVRMVTTSHESANVSDYIRLMVTVRKSYPRHEHHSPPATLCANQGRGIVAA
jgi:hypothetical protein